MGGNVMKIEPLLSIFEAECGHRWIGASNGYYACPVCGLYDGDHYLTSVEELPVQVDDFGTAWEGLLEEGKKAWAAREAEAQYDQLQ
jgi:hypothetical protein